MIAGNRNDLARILRQQRVMRGLTLGKLAARSGVSSSHLGRIERGERFPSARILRKLAEPLGLAEGELFSIAGYLSPQPPTKAEKPSGRRLDPYTSMVLSQEPVETQRVIITILTVFKSMAKGSCDVGFAEYIRRKYPELDEDTITMVQDIIEHPRGAKEQMQDKK